MGEPRYTSREADYEDAESIANVMIRCCEAGREVEVMN
jgi:hypothetical protein